MKIKSSLSQLARFARDGAVVFLFAGAARLTHADPVIWNGPDIDFTQTASFDPSNPTDPAAVDSITPAVSISRQNNEPLFNPAAGEEGPDGSDSPKDTEWAFGTITDVSDIPGLSVFTFASLQNGDIADQILFQPMVLHLVSEDIYINILFTAWGQHHTGGFEYTRSTAPAVVAPTVSLSTPADGTVYAAPAGVHLTASASVAGGTVTNVQYFAGGTPLGQAASDPFAVTGSSLGAGNYALTAVATASGISTTSAVVNISVVTPVAVNLSSARAAGNNFIFNYSATPGLRYVVQSSSNLVTWAPVVTNVAAGNPVSFTNNFTTSGNRYFRVGRLPNP